MWVFRQVTKEEATGALVLRKDGIVLHFREGIHVFGRQASKCSCVLEADAQVSRQHATVKVSYSNVHGKQSGIFIRDGTVNKPKSSSGTYVNEKAVQANFLTTEQSNTNVWGRLEEGDIVRFGRGLYSFRVCKASAPVFMMSKVNKISVAGLKRSIAKLGGRLLKKHMPGQVDFLVMSDFSSTYKCILAMTDERMSIVNTKYIEDMSRPDIYQSIVDVARTTVLPAKYTIMRPTEHSSQSTFIERPLNENAATYKKYKWNLWRIKLFEGITFVLLFEPDPNMNYAILLENCGGNLLPCYDNLDKLPVLSDAEKVEKMVFVIPATIEVHSNKSLKTYLRDIERYGLLTISYAEIAKRIVDKLPIPMRRNRVGNSLQYPQTKPVDLARSSEPPPDISESSTANATSPNGSVIEQTSSYLDGTSNKNRDNGVDNKNSKENYTDVSESVSLSLPTGSIGSSRVHESTVEKELPGVNQAHQLISEQQNDFAGTRSHEIVDSCNFEGRVEAEAVGTASSDTAAVVNGSGCIEDEISYHRKPVTGWVNRICSKSVAREKNVVTASLRITKNSGAVQQARLTGKKRSKRMVPSGRNFKTFRKLPVPMCKNPVSYEDMYENENQPSQRALQLQAIFDEDDARQREADLAFWDDGDGNPMNSGNAFERMMANNSKRKAKTTSTKRKKALSRKKRKR